MGIQTPSRRRERQTGQADRDPEGKAARNTTPSKERLNTRCEEEEEINIIIQLNTNRITK
jgi:hypothetical protein